MNEIRELEENGVSEEVHEVWCHSAEKGGLSKPFPEEISTRK